MEQKIKTLDIENTIGRVVLSDGKTRLDVPRLSMRKIIQVVKFLGIDGVRLYNNLQDILADEAIDEFEKIAIVFDELKEEQLVRIMSILLELDDNQTLELEPEEMIDVLIVYSERVDFSNLYRKVQTLMEKMFNKEMPDASELMNRMFPKTEPEPEQEEPDPQEEDEKAVQEGASSPIS